MKAKKLVENILGSSDLKQPRSQDSYLKALGRAKAAGQKRAAAAPFAEKLRSLTLVSRLLEESLMEALPTVLQELTRVLDGAVRDRIIERFALAGGFAVIYYGAPIHTADADFLVVFPVAASGLLNPSPIFGYFERRGAHWDGEHLVFNGLKFQLVPANEGLNAEALATAPETPDGFPVVDLEHLIAMKLAVGRGKDRLHISHLVRSGAALDQGKLADILARYHLADRWARFQAESTDWQ